MGRTPRGAYLWPGLPQMWNRGTWSALAVAVGAAALLNLALASSLLWSELFPPGVRNLVWAAAVALWACSAMISYRWDCRHLAERENDSVDDTFAVALDHYLKGNWLEAERVLDGLLRRNARDVDAGLMLATLFRHTGRHDEAVGQLDRLQCFEGSRKWQEEIRRELELVREARTAKADRPGGSTSAGSPDPAAPMSDAA